MDTIPVMTTPVVVFQPNGSYRFHQPAEFFRTPQFDYIGNNKFSAMSRWYHLPDGGMMTGYYCDDLFEVNKVYGYQNPIGRQFFSTCSCVGLNDYYGPIAFFKYDKEEEFVDFTKNDIDYIINYQKECTHKGKTKSKQKKKWWKFF